MKRSLLTLVLALVAIANSWAYNAYVGGIYYNLDASAKTAEVTSNYDDKYTGSVAIPSSITYDGVTYSVTSIGDAFSYCYGLTSVEIPNSVTSIGESAFWSCSGLKSVEIPNSVTSIGQGAFFGCEGLISITIGNSVTSIGDWAFEYCSGLTSVTIPNSVTSIGISAFSYCSGLTSITIPNSVTSIGYKAFFGCNSLPVINNIRYADTYLVGVVDRNCTSATIKTGTKWIGDWAFYECSGLKSVTIPNSVTSIGGDAFSYCSSLKSITIGNSVKSIDDYAFSYCSGLTSIEIPNSVTSIGGRAFYKCYGLKSVTIGNSVTSIGDGVFYYCWDLTSVILGTGLKSIGQGTFVGCGALKEMVCHSTDFINCDGNPFYDSGYESGTLYVPASFIGAYRTTDPWYNWGSIKTLDDWAAGIELPTTSTDASPIYDLQGRRQSSMRKGINIIRGKKYLAK